MPFDRRAYPADATLGTFSANDGWSLRTYAQRARGRPHGSILWLGGRGDIFEKYIETLDIWAEQGWNVESFDWRGQGGSGRLGPDPRVGHADDFAPWIDDLACYFADWSGRNPGPHVVMGHSMGGHLVLRALTDRSIAPAKAVLVAPMLGFDGPLPFAWAARLSAFLTRATGGDRPAWKTNERPALRTASRQAFLTSDAGRYADEIWWKVVKPELELGPPSWAWMAAAYRSLHLLRRPGVLETVDRPILIIATEGDRLVSPAAIAAAARRLPRAHLKMFGRDVAHEILRERDGVRDEALATIADFLQ